MKRLGVVLAVVTPLSVVPEISASNLFRRLAGDAWLAAGDWLPSNRAPNCERFNHPARPGLRDATSDIVGLIAKILRDFG